MRRKFQIDENGRKVSKKLENMVGKGEIALYKQFLLFPKCFRKFSTPENQGLFGKGLDGPFQFGKKLQPKFCHFKVGFGYNM